MCRAILWGGSPSSARRLNRQAEDGLLRAYTFMLIAAREDHWGFRLDHFSILCRFHSESTVCPTNNSMGLLWIIKLPHGCHAVIAILLTTAAVCNSAICVRYAIRVGTAVYTTVFFNSDLVARERHLLVWLWRLGHVGYQAGCDTAVYSCTVPVNVFTIY